MPYHLDTSDREAFVRLIKPDSVVAVGRICRWRRSADSEIPTTVYSYMMPEPDSERVWRYTEHVPWTPHEFFVGEFVRGDESKTLFAELCARKQKINRTRHSGSDW